jgi:S-adenosylmethionine uptake transporter
MRAGPHRPPSRVLIGIGLATFGYALFAVQDAVVKWLVPTYSVPQILFMRSVVITVVALALTRGRAVELVRSSQKGQMLLRTVLMFTAWLSFYSAARRLGLAEMTTLYFAAPVIVVALSGPLLGEIVGPAHWAAVAVGFAGIVLAAGPTGGIDPLPACMALFAAACWAGSILLMRVMSRTETTANVMLVTNALFALASAVMLPWAWRAPALPDLGLMLGMGCASAAGQYFLYQGFRDAPAAVLAPIEYTGLVWAFLYGYLIWADVPGLPVFAGAALIAASSLGLVWHEARASRRPYLRA